ncbi:hypothetical protein DSOUD_1975 [Desulfuromonas soudanensis]|uniref:Lipoprotein n=1 Tax=Desulfuromonas soudanensis TaxID=1603606 RepID=A0A0M5IZ64_9BACT|nr:hypothetical protein [Desulfuromonas soudanensis]ALC16744.1 hypothetical protein DSOUD_1975 [Desulfuromonas soudanensis]
MKCFNLFVVLALLFLSGCGITNFPAYEAGTAISPGKVLVIAQVDLQPGVEKDKSLKGVVMINESKDDEVRLFMSPLAEVPVKKGSFFPFSPKGGSTMDLSFIHPSLILMDPGERFVRMGLYTLSASTSWRPSSSGQMRGSVEFKELHLWGDLKLEIPAGAKAVYIGTLRYSHNGVESQKVSVVDDYKKAMVELNKMNLEITSKDVVKRLAQVVREN